MDQRSLGSLLKGEIQKPNTRLRGILLFLVRVCSPTHIHTTFLDINTLIAPIKLALYGNHIESTPVVNNCLMPDRDSNTKLMLNWGDMVPLDTETRTLYTPQIPFFMSQVLSLTDRYHSDFNGSDA